MAGILEGKVAIVTGSGQGVGFEIARALAREGCRVVTNNRKPGSPLIAFEEDLELTVEEREKLEGCSGDAKTAADRICAEGGTAVPFFGNVNTPEVAEECVQHALNAFGRVDILVNNAHSAWTGNVRQMTPKEWHRVTDAKLNAAFYMVHSALPHMLEQGYGRIFNASSDGWLGLKDRCAYGAACAGMWAFTRSISQDLEGTGITANAYTPIARTRAWYSALVTYRMQGVPAEIIEANAPSAMKYTAESFAPFFAYLGSEMGADISGNMFKIDADGVIGIWNDPFVGKTVRIEEGKTWTIEELTGSIPTLLPENKFKTTI